MTPGTVLIVTLNILRVTWGQGSGGSTISTTPDPLNSVFGFSLNEPGNSPVDHNTLDQRIDKWTEDLLRGSSNIFQEIQNTAVNPSSGQQSSGGNNPPGSVEAQLPQGLDFLSNRGAPPRAGNLDVSNLPQLGNISGNLFGTFLPIDSGTVSNGEQSGSQSNTILDRNNVQLPTIEQLGISGDFFGFPLFNEVPTTSPAPTTTEEPPLLIFRRPSADQANSVHGDLGRDLPPIPSIEELGSQSNNNFLNALLPPDLSPNTVSPPGSQSSPENTQSNVESNLGIPPNSGIGISNPNALPPRPDSGITNEQGVGTAFESPITQNEQGSQGQNRGQTQTSGGITDSFQGGGVLENAGIMTTTISPANDNMFGNSLDLTGTEQSGSQTVGTFGNSLEVSGQADANKGINEIGWGSNLDSQGTQNEQGTQAGGLQDGGMTSLQSNTLDSFGGNGKGEPGNTIIDNLPGFEPTIGPNAGGLFGNTFDSNSEKQLQNNVIDNSFDVMGQSNSKASTNEQGWGSLFDSSISGEPNAGGGSLQGNGLQPKQNTGQGQTVDNILGEGQSSNLIDNSPGMASKDSTGTIGVMDNALDPTGQSKPQNGGSFDNFFETSTQNTPIFNTNEQGWDSIFGPSDTQSSQSGTNQNTDIFTTRNSGQEGSQGSGNTENIATKADIQSQILFEIPPESNLQNNGILDNTLDTPRQINSQNFDAQFSEPPSITTTPDSTNPVATSGPNAGENSPPVDFNDNPLLLGIPSIDQLFDPNFNSNPFPNASTFNGPVNERNTFDNQNAANPAVDGQSTGTFDVQSNFSSGNLNTINTNNGMGNPGFSDTSGLGSTDGNSMQSTGNPNTFILVDQNTNTNNIADPIFQGPNQIVDTGSNNNVNSNQPIRPTPQAFNGNNLFQNILSSAVPTPGTRFSNELPPIPDISQLGQENFGTETTAQPTPSGQAGLQQLWDILNQDGQLPPPGQTSSTSNIDQNQAVIDNNLPGSGTGILPPDPDQPRRIGDNFSIHMSRQNQQGVTSRGRTETSQSGTNSGFTFIDPSSSAVIEAKTPDNIFTFMNEPSSSSTPSNIASIDIMPDIGLNPDPFARNENVNFPLIMNQPTTTEKPTTTTTMTTTTMTTTTPLPITTTSMSGFGWGSGSEFDNLFVTAPPKFRTTGFDGIFDTSTQSFETSTAAATTTTSIFRLNNVVPSNPGPFPNNVVPSNPGPFPNNVVPSNPGPIPNNVVPSNSGPFPNNVVPSNPGPIPNNVVPSNPGPFPNIVVPSNPGPVPNNVMPSNRGPISNNVVPSNPGPFSNNVLPRNPTPNLLFFPRATVTTTARPRAIVGPPRTNVPTFNNGISSQNNVNNLINTNQFSGNRFPSSATGSNFRASSIPVQSGTNFRDPNALFLTPTWSGQRAQTSARPFGQNVQNNFQSRIPQNQRTNFQRTSQFGNRFQSPNAQNGIQNQMNSFQPPGQNTRFLPNQNIRSNNQQNVNPTVLQNRFQTPSTRVNQFQSQSGQGNTLQNNNALQNQNARRNWFLSLPRQQQILVLRRLWQMRAAQQARNRNNNNNNNNNAQNSQQFQQNVLNSNTIQNAGFPNSGRNRIQFPTQNQGAARPTNTGIAPNIPNTQFIPTNIAPAPQVTRPPLPQPTPSIRNPRVLIPLLRLMQSRINQQTSNPDLRRQLLLQQVSRLRTIINARSSPAGGLATQLPQRIPPASPPLVAVPVTPTVQIVPTGVPVRPVPIPQRVIPTRRPFDFGAPFQSNRFVDFSLPFEQAVQQMVARRRGGITLNNAPTTIRPRPPPLDLSIPITTVAPTLPPGFNIPRITRLRPTPVVIPRRPVAIPISQAFQRIERMRALSRDSNPFRENAALNFPFGNFQGGTSILQPVRNFPAVLQNRQRLIVPITRPPTTIAPPTVPTRFTQRFANRRPPIQQGGSWSWLGQQLQFLRNQGSI